VLFALDTATGALYESTNPTGSTTALIGTPGTWAQHTVPWGTAPPALTSAGIGHAGQTELWTLSGRTATPYTLTGTTLSAEGPGSPLTAPSDDWPLTDGSPLALGRAATTATDTTGANTASLTTAGATWAADDYFGTDISLDGQNGYLTPPAATIPDTDTTPSLSLWFKTTTADGVLASLQHQALSQGNTASGGFNPFLYIGSDGKLHAEWWTGALTVITSAAAVDDGIWHHAVLTASAGSQTLYLDGQPQGSATGTPNLTFANPTNLTLGAGYLGGNWPTERYYLQTPTLDRFNGQIAAITLTK
jgi:Concanavalin A-like lectin/glucanases superfamily